MTTSAEQRLTLARQEALGVWASVRRRPVRAMAVLLAATAVGGAISGGVVTLFTSPFEAIGGVFSSFLFLAMVGVLVIGAGSALAFGASMVAGYFLILLPRQDRRMLVGRVRWLGMWVSVGIAELAMVLVSVSTTITLLVTVVLIVLAVLITQATRGHARTLRWLAGHLAGATREFDPGSGDWVVKNAEWDGERLISAEAWYPPTLRASDPQRRAAIDRAVMWAMRHESQTYGLEWPAGTRMARVVSEPPLPTKVMDGRWPELPGVVVGACALVHADSRVRQADDTLLGLRTWNPDAQRDLLIAGVKGAGKTILIRGLIVRGLTAGWFPGGALTIDGKASGDYASLEGRRGVLRVARTPAAWLEALRWIVALTQERYDADYEYQAGRRAERPSFPRILLVIDEIQAVIGELGAEGLELINSLARMARGAMVSMIVATQRPDAKDAVPGAIRDQLEDRVAVGYMSPDGGRMVLDDAWSLVVSDDDPTGENANKTTPRGRAVVRIAGRLSRIQIPWLDSPVFDPGMEDLYPPRLVGADDSPPNEVPPRSAPMIPRQSAPAETAVEPLSVPVPQPSTPPPSEGRTGRRGRLTD